MTKLQQRYGPWALVTGASSGIGKAFCQQLAAQGFDLVMVARRHDKLEQLSGALVAEHRIKTLVIAGNLSELAFLQHLEKLTQPLQIGLSVNNAGYALTGPLLDHGLPQQLALLELNCRACLMLNYVFAQRMRQQGRGGIIQVASASAFLPIPFWANYAASKAYALHLAEALWYEMKSHGVDVLALCPGPTHSEFATVAGTQSGGMDAMLVVKKGLAGLGKKPSVVIGAGPALINFLLRWMPRRLLCSMGAMAVQSMRIKS